LVRNLVARLLHELDQVGSPHTELTGAPPRYSMKTVFANHIAWDEFGHGESEEPLVDEDQIRNLITALDGDTRTLVTIYAEEAHLAVGGDAHSNLIVYATFDGETFQNLVTPTAGNQRVRIVAGAQPGDHPARDLVSVEDALAAAITFAHDGSLSAEANWETS
jgi:hypothetical protein